MKKFFLLQNKNRHNKETFYLSHYFAYKKIKNFILLKIFRKLIANFQFANCTLQTIFGFDFGEKRWRELNPVTIYIKSYYNSESEQHIKVFLK